MSHCVRNASPAADDAPSSSMEISGSLLNAQHPNIASTVQPMAKRGKAYLTIDDKLLGARDHKDEGNAFFKDKKYSRAIVAYNKVLAFTRNLPGSKRTGGGGIHEMVQTAIADRPGSVTNEQEIEAMEIECQALTNIATCNIKLERGGQALEACRKALSLWDKLNTVSSEATREDTEAEGEAGGQRVAALAWKTHLRHAEALSLLKEFDDAKAAFKRAWELAPDATNKNAIAEAIKRLKGQRRGFQAEERVKGSALFSKAFGGDGSGDEDSGLNHVGSSSNDYVGMGVTSSGNGARSAESVGSSGRSTESSASSST